MLFGRITRLALAVGLVAAMNACGDATGLRAQFNNREVLMLVFPVNGTDQTLPAGILIRAPEAARVDVRWAFDIAFDMDNAGKVTVYTVRAMGSEVVPSLARVGLQIDSTNPYAGITLAPGSGFVYDSSLTLAVGHTLLIDKIDPTCAQFGGGFLGFNIKAKMIIDSVDLPTRQIFVKMLSNPNCGFRSLQTGRPEE